EVFEEKLCCFVKQWTPWNFGASGDADESAFEQTVDHSIHRDAAHGFDVGARDRLAIGDERQCFQSRAAEPHRFAFGKKLAHPAGASRVSDDGPAVDLFEELKSALRLEVFD